MRRPVVFTLICLGILLAACSSGDDLATEDDATSTTTTSTTLAPSTTALTGRRSGDPEPAASVDPATATTVVQPTPETTSTTTTVVEANPNESLVVDPIFEPIMNDLIEFTELPVALPLDVGEGFDGLAATLVAVDKDSYNIVVGFGECSGGNVCRVGSIDAIALDNIDYDIEADGVPLPLPGRRTGYFFDASCGANCGDGYIRWIDNDVVYSVGLKAARVEAVLPFAWAAIRGDLANTPTAPDRCIGATIPDDGRVAQVAPRRNITWLLVCSDDGVAAEVIHGGAELEWLDVDGNGARDIALTDEGGQTRLFLVDTTSVQPVLDNETFTRLTIGDMRCGDTNSDGFTEILDAVDGARMAFVNPLLVDRSTLVDGVRDLPSCL